MNQRSKKIVIERRLFIVPSRKLNHPLKISSYFDPKLIYEEYTERAIFVFVSRFVDIRRRKKERRIEIGRIIDYLGRKQAVTSSSTRTTFQRRGTFVSLFVIHEYDRSVHRRNDWSNHSTAPFLHRYRIARLETISRRCQFIQILFRFYMDRFYFETDFSDNKMRSRCLSLFSWIQNDRYFGRDKI